MKELIQIQSELKAPKSQYNNFGKYHYRNLEDIFEAVKPLLVKYDCLLNVVDELVQVGDRYYIKAIAKISKGDIQVSSVAYARESLDKKGMDDSQITGATSSYARKYALNALLLIDDTKDADTQDNTVKKEQIKTPIIDSLGKLKLKLKEAGATDSETALSILSSTTGDKYTTLDLNEITAQTALADFIRNSNKQ